MMTETAYQKWRYNNKNEEGQSRSQEEKYFLIAQSSTVHNDLGGQQFAQIGNYFTIWKNFLLPISPSKHNQSKICKKCHDILSLPKLINLYLSFIFQIGEGQCWPPKFPLCTVSHVILDVRSKSWTHHLYDISSASATTHTVNVVTYTF